MGRKVIKDIYDDRNEISLGFFHYMFWGIGLIMSIVPPILMSFMKEYYYLSKDATEQGFMCMGLGLGILTYRIGVMAINDITKKHSHLKKKMITKCPICKKQGERHDSGEYGDICKECKEKENMYNNLKENFENAG